MSKYSHNDGASSASLSPYERRCRKIDQKDEANIERLQNLIEVTRVFLGQVGLQTAAEPSSYLDDSRVGSTSNHRTSQRLSDGAMSERYGSQHTASRHSRQQRLAPLPENSNWNANEREHEIASAQSTRDRGARSAVSAQSGSVRSQRLGSEAIFASSKASRKEFESEHVSERASRDDSKTLPARFRPRLPSVRAAPPDRGSVARSSQHLAPSQTATPRKEKYVPPSFTSRIPVIPKDSISCVNDSTVSAGQGSDFARTVGKKSRERE